MKTLLQLIRDIPDSEDILIKIDGVTRQWNVGKLIRFKHPWLLHDVSDHYVTELGTHVFVLV